MNIRREFIWTLAGFMTFEFICSSPKIDAVLQEHLAEEGPQQGPTRITYTSASTIGIESTTTTTTAL